MSPRFAFFYLMNDDVDRIRMTVPLHVAHWHEIGLAGYSGGPFQDRSGGLITFDAEDTEHAERAVRSDPFMKEDLLDSYWLKEWVPEVTSAILP